MVKTHLHSIGVFPFDLFISSHIPFFSRAFISSIIAFLHSRTFKASSTFLEISISERLVVNAWKEGDR